MDLSEKDTREKIIDPWLIEDTFILVKFINVIIHYKL